MGRERQGQSIAARRAALGIKSQAEFARETGLARETIAAAEAGTASARTYTRIEAWFESLQLIAPASSDEPPITFEVTGPSVEWTVRVSGPTSQADQLRRQVVDLLREWQLEHPAEEE